MSEAKYQFNVKMACGGCSGAVTRAVNKLEGVKSVNADLKTQLVDVVAEPQLSYDDVLGAIKKTGKEVISGKTL